MIKVLSKLVALLALVLLSACYGNVDIPGDCLKAQLDAHPARARGIDDLEIRARLTANGVGVPDVRLDFWFESAPGKDPTTNQSAVTDTNGVARARLSDFDLKDPYVREQVQKSRFFVAILDSRFVPHGYKGPVYCSTRDHATLTLTG